MKAVIAISALAGVVLTGVVGAAVLGYRAIDARRHSHHQVHTVKIEKVSSGDSWVGQDQCRFQAERSFTENVSSGDALRVEAGSGSLDVVGVPGLAEVRAVAKACASHEEFLDDLRLSSDMEGSTLHVRTHYPEWGRRWSGGNRYARLDLRLEVPEGMAADIQDGSGEMALTGLGDLNVDDGSGEIALSDINGRVYLDDGSGEIEASGVNGPMRIHDSSGEIVVNGMVGDLEIQDSSGEVSIQGLSGNLDLQDGSGEIELEGIAGTVTLQDGSGEIDASGIEGTFHVVRDGSGSINVDGVGGDFIVEADGGGSIHHSDVAGTVDIPKKKRDR